MKLPFLKDFEDKWVAMTKRPQKVVAWARSYHALENKLSKDQKNKVTLMKVPRFDRIFH